MARPAKHPHRTNPLLLCVECSTMYCSVAVISVSGCIAEHSLISRITHSKRLLPAMEGIMQECELEWMQLDSLAISLGPGSFTGLRIGLTTMKGIAMAVDLPIIGISSIKALANQFPHCHLPICPILDARKQEVYTGIYETKSGQLKTIMEPVVCGITQLVGNVDSPTLFVGDGVKLYREQIKDHLGDKAFFAQGQQIFPRASAVGTLALAKFATNDFLDPTSASPVYIRPSDAEVNLRNPQQQR